MAGSIANDITGRTYGLLIVLERTDKPDAASSANRSSWWLCECACGRCVPVRADRLNLGLRRCCKVSHHRDLDRRFKRNREKANAD